MQELKLKFVEKYELENIIVIIGNNFGIFGRSQFSRKKHTH